MGYCSESYTILGYYIDKKLNVETKERGCKCKLTQAELRGNFCPQCGSPVTVTDTHLLKNVLAENLPEGSVFEVFSNPENPCFYVGRKLEVVLLDELTSTDFLHEAQTLRTLLKINNVDVSVASFGIHNFLYESY